MRNRGWVKRIKNKIGNNSNKNIDDFFSNNEGKRIIKSV